MKLSYESREIVDFYFSQNDLQLPEKEIFKIIKPQLKNMKMLDIGVGAGRTSMHFMHEVSEYFGVDYSHKFIDASKQKFNLSEDSLIFQTGDARQLSAFQNNYFDFVLFSFNGLDTIDKEDRITALNEMKRVCKKDGLLCFSAHNMNSIPKLLKPKLSFNIKDVLWQIKHVARILLINRGKLVTKNKDYTTIYDGHLNFNMCLYYIKPLAQIKQLEALGFSNIRLFSLDSGKEITHTFQNSEVKDAWIYYLCNKS